MKWLPYPEACVEFLKDDALKGALLDAWKVATIETSCSSVGRSCISIGFPADDLPQSLATPLSLDNTLIGSFTLTVHTSRLVNVQAIPEGRTP